MSGLKEEKISGTVVYAGEFLELIDLPMKTAIEMIRDGRITDAKTVAALLWLQAFGIKPE